ERWRVLADEGLEHAALAIEICRVEPERQQSALVYAVGWAAVRYQPQQPSSAKRHHPVWRVVERDIGAVLGRLEDLEPVLGRQDGSDEGCRHVMLNVAALEHWHDEHAGFELVYDRSQRGCRGPQLHGVALAQLRQEIEELQFAGVE